MGCGIVKQLGNGSESILCCIELLGGDTANDSKHSRINGSGIVEERAKYFLDTLDVA
jgi:hypothetical protein